MKFLEKTIRKASQSKFWLRILNTLLTKAIPFNRSLGVKIISISGLKVKVLLPYKKANKNHIGTIHACALATAAELSSGLIVIQHAPPSTYRLILKNLSIDYLYRANTDVIAVSEIEDEQVLKIPDNTDSKELNLSSTLYNSEGNIVCKAKSLWQIKRWSEIAGT